MIMSAFNVIELFFYAIDVLMASHVRKKLQPIMPELYPNCENKLKNL